MKAKVAMGLAALWASPAWSGQARLEDLPMTDGVPLAPVVQLLAWGCWMLAIFFAIQALVWRAKAGPNRRRAMGVCSGFALTLAWAGLLLH